MQGTTSLEEYSPSYRGKQGTWCKGLFQGVCERPQVVSGGATRTVHLVCNLRRRNLGGWEQLALI